MPRADRLISELCDEIDMLKEEVRYYKTLYNEERAQYNQHLNESIETSKQGIANMLMLCLSVEDKPDGSISISNENRKRLAKDLKTT